MECIVCGQEVDYLKAMDEMIEFGEQADMLGMDSLTEQQQVAIEGNVCSYECYTMLS